MNFKIDTVILGTFKIHKIRILNLCFSGDGPLLSTLSLRLCSWGIKYTGVEKLWFSTAEKSPFITETVQPMTLSDLERGRERSKFFKRVYLIMLVPCDYRTTKFGRITRGEGLVLGDSHAPPHTHTQWGGAQALSNFRGSLLFMRTSFDAELPNLTW